MVFRTESQELPFTYPPASAPSDGVRQLLDDAVAALDADEKNPELRKALAALLAEPFDGTHFLCEWGGWRLVTITTKAKPRPGRESDARAWLRDQTGEEPPTSLGGKMATAFLDRHGLIPPDDLFQTEQKDSVRRA